MMVIGVEALSVCKSDCPGVTRNPPWKWAFTVQGDITRTHPRTRAHRHTHIYVEVVSRVTGLVWFEYGCKCKKLAPRQTLCVSVCVCPSMCVVLVLIQSFSNYLLLPTHKICGS